jgi:hypothetical protein
MFDQNEKRRYSIKKYSTIFLWSNESNVCKLYANHKKRVPALNH